MKFDFKVIAKSFPTICLVIGVFLLVGSAKLGFGFWIGLLGVLLIFVAVGLYVYYVRQKYR
jgi:hypothetical protein